MINAQHFQDPELVFYRRDITNIVLDLLGITKKLNLPLSYPYDSLGQRQEGQ
jgi:hypothetical protein